MNIVYRLTGGIATDIRFIPSGYVLQSGELLVAPGLVPADGSLPLADVLSDPTTLAAMQSARVAIQQRLATDTAERQQAALDAAILALVNSTPAQLMTFARNNFPTLTLAEQNKIGTILNILAVAVRPQVRA